MQRTLHEGIDPVRARKRHRALGSRLAMLGVYDFDAGKLHLGRARGRPNAMLWTYENRYDQIAAGGNRRALDGQGIDWVNDCGSQRRQTVSHGKQPLKVMYQTRRLA
jgi:hypothetical protein